jgi:hypothetical protein
MLHNGGHEGRHASVPGEAASAVYRQVIEIRKLKMENRKPKLENQ